MSTDKTNQVQSGKQALELLMNGNQRFIKNEQKARNLQEEVQATKNGQSPYAVILSCMDSRTSVEHVFDQGMGEVFSIRMAGNVLSGDALGSMEYAVKAVGSKLILVLGHTHCGAVKGACADVKMGNLTDLLAKIRPSVEEVQVKMPTVATDDADFVQAVATHHVVNSLQDILDSSSLIKQAYEEGQVGLVAGMYDIATGKVTVLDQMFRS